VKKSLTFFLYNTCVTSRFICQLLPTVAHVSCISPEWSPHLAQPHLRGTGRSLIAAASKKLIIFSTAATSHNDKFKQKKNIYK